MSLISIAAKAGTTSTYLKRFIQTGEASVSLASRLGVTRSNINDFVNGRAGVSIAGLLGATTSAAQELRNAIGREGAIGLILGIACGRG